MTYSGLRFGFPIVEPFGQTLVDFILDGLQAKSDTGVREEKEKILAEVRKK